MDNIKSAIGIGLSLVFEAQIFPFLLSSAFTSRTLVKEKNDQENVIKDLYISLFLSIGFSLLMSLFLRDFLTFVIGSGFAIILFKIYLKRGCLT